ncbi:MAG: cytochrome C oxidase subunit IV family protein [Bacteroidetes bacterium]|nr:cytochrome C oxidase subunit IV family protein [Bacteroidota bacterium]
MPRALVAFFFLALTLFKAGYIVSVFMHLGDERKNFLITVLIPLTLFIWFIIAFLTDGFFWLHMNSITPTR